MYYEENLDEDTGGASLAKQDFINGVERFYASILKYKEDHKDELNVYWKPAYDKIEKSFVNVLSLIDFNWIDAKTIIDGMDCYKFENFAQYVFNTSTNKSLNIKSTLVKSKTIRRKRNTKCPLCQIECVMTEDKAILKCPKCGHEIMKDKAGAPDNIINGEKHISKQLDKLDCLTNLPSSLTKLQPYFTQWLTDYSLIYDWLIYSDRFDNFQTKFKNRLGKVITNFNVKIPCDKQHKLSFAQYEIFSEEFYKMVEAVNKIAKKSCNVDGSDEKILEIVGDYAGKMKRKFKSIYDLPKESFEYNYNGTYYSLGTYFMKLAITINYDQHHIKNKVLQLITQQPANVNSSVSSVSSVNSSATTTIATSNSSVNYVNSSVNSSINSATSNAATATDAATAISNATDAATSNAATATDAATAISNATPAVNVVDMLKFPGLTFNFNELFGPAQHPPKSFVYNENFNKINYEIFHFDLHPFTRSDVVKLTTLLLRFNNYYRKAVEKRGKKQNTKTNSPLFVCVFTNIITSFPYFKHKYSAKLQQLPHRITESITKADIDRIWFDFLTDAENKEIFEGLDKIVDDAEELAETTANSNEELAETTANSNEIEDDDNDIFNEIF